MPTDDLELRQVTDRAKTTAGYRRRRAEQARYELLIAAVAKDAAERLAELRSDRPAETGSLVDAQTVAHDDKERVATGLVELAGLGDADMPWPAWQHDLEDRLRMAETRYLEVLDEADNPDAYGVEAVQARFTADQSHCDVEALQAALDEVKAKVGQPNRANRRAAAKAAPKTAPAAD